MRFCGAPRTMKRGPSGARATTEPCLRLTAHPCGNRIDTFRCGSAGAHEFRRSKGRRHEGPERACLDGRHGSELQPCAVEERRAAVLVARHARHVGAHDVRVRAERDFGRDEHGRVHRARGDARRRLHEGAAQAEIDQPGRRAGAQPHGGVRRARDPYESPPIGRRHHDPRAVCLVHGDHATASLTSISPNWNAARNASTTCGSKSVDVPLTMMSLASKGDMALRYGRSLVSES